jgi:hypothetical protein
MMKKIARFEILFAVNDGIIDVLKRPAATQNMKMEKYKIGTFLVRSYFRALNTLLKSDNLGIRKKIKGIL